MSSSDQISLRRISVWQRHSARTENGSVELRRNDVFIHGLHIILYLIVLRFNASTAKFANNKLFCFYCASACLCMHSAILFYQFRPSVRPFVCLTNADTVCKRRDISSQFFDLCLQNSRENPISRVLNVRLVEKNWQIVPFISKTVRYTPCFIKRPPYLIAHNFSKC